MIQKFHQLEINTKGRKLYNFTSSVQQLIKREDFNKGILNINILHTSASIIVQENADSDVQKDILNFFDRLVPMDNSYIHKMEGKDDMPAHLKTILTSTNLCLSIKNSNLVLGTWQGLFLFEHRIEKHQRKINLHYIGD